MPGTLSFPLENKSFDYCPHCAVSHPIGEHPDEECAGCKNPVDLCICDDLEAYPEDNGNFLLGREGGAS